MAFAGTDVGLRGIADDGIHCDGGLGVNCYASCHETHGVNSRIAHSHWRHQIMPSKQQQLWLEKHWKHIITPIEILACRQHVFNFQSDERATEGLFHSHGNYKMHCTCQWLVEMRIAG